MVARSCVVTGALAIAVASAAVGCGALIGIEDGIADPGADATTTGDATGDGGGPGRDANVTDASTAPDTSVAPGPIGRPGGDTTTLPCGNASCALPAESCCAYRSSSQPGLYTGVCAATCAPPGPGSDRVDVLHCSGPSNCPATAPRCCLPVGVAPVTTCKTSCNLNAEVQLCEPGVAGQCGSTRSCGRFTGQTMPPTWGYCN